MKPETQETVIHRRQFPPRLPGSGPQCERMKTAPAGKGWKATARFDRYALVGKGLNEDSQLLRFPRPGGKKWTWNEPGEE